MKAPGAVALAIAVLGSLVGPVSAQETGGRYYSETGHTLDARFLSFVDDHGGVSLLGFPITDAFIDPHSGWLVQYLHNARLELGSEGGGGAVSVRLSALGEALGGWEAPLTPDRIPASADATCRYYPESGHAVCHAFLDVFLARGGPGLFGYPISEFRLEGERIVQYFQAFRFDWYPEAPAGSQVRMAPLGQEHFAASGYDPALLRPRLPADPLLYRVLELRPSVALTHPVSAGIGNQTVYVVVRDQNLNPVSGVTVVLTIHLAQADRILLLPATDGRGLSRIDFEFSDQPRGFSVELEVTVVLDRLQRLTRDSFLIW